MRRFPALLLALSLALVALPAGAAPLLDTAFGGDGIGTAFPNGGVATAVGIDGAHRLVAVGYTTGKHVDVAVARFEPNGSPDTSFGAHGHRTYDLGGADYAFDAAVIANGGIGVVSNTVLDRLRTISVDRIWPASALAITRAAVLIASPKTRYARR